MISFKAFKGISGLAVDAFNAYVWSVALERRHRERSPLMIRYTNALDALRDAVHSAPSVIAWVARTKAQFGHWVVYNPVTPIPDSTPEILCLTRGVILPLSEHGETVLHSALAAAL
jgi:hypothetical protein